MNCLTVFVLKLLTLSLFLLSYSHRKKFHSLNLSLKTNDFDMSYFA